MNFVKMEREYLNEAQYLIGYYEALKDVEEGKLKDVNVKVR